MPEIKIKCKGSRSVSYGTLKTFQGNLKSLSEKRAKELMAQIKELGWIAPVFVYNKNEIIDGHQRLAVLPTLIAEGYTIDKIPVVDITANTRTEAAKILLAINSRYGEISNEGLYEFMSNMELEVEDIIELELPDINIDEFIPEFFVDSPLVKKSGGGEGEGDGGEDKSPRQCPECGFEF